MAPSAVAPRYSDGQITLQQKRGCVVGEVATRRLLAQPPGNAGLLPGRWVPLRESFPETLPTDVGFVLSYTLH